MKSEVSLAHLIEGQGVALIAQGKDLACRERLSSGVNPRRYSNSADKCVQIHCAPGTSQRNDAVNSSGRVTRAKVLTGVALSGAARGR